jgi:hypothetical protein
MAHNARQNNRQRSPVQTRFMALVKDTIQTMYSFGNAEDEENEQQREALIQHQLQDIERLIRDPGIDVSEMITERMVASGILSDTYIALIFRLLSAPNISPSIHHSAVHLFYILVGAMRPEDIDKRTPISQRTILAGAIAADAPMEITRTLLDLGANPNAPDNNGITPVLLAADVGRVDILEELIGHDGDIHHQDNRGRTALVHAASENRRDAIRFLLDHGADIDLPNNEGRTPLLHAVQWPNQRETVQYLLNQGADPHLQNKTGANAWNIANEDTLNTLAPYFPNREMNNNNNRHNGGKRRKTRRHHHRRRATIRRSKTHRRRR